MAKILSNMYKKNLAFSIHKSAYPAFAFFQKQTHLFKKSALNLDVISSLNTGLTLNAIGSNNGQASLISSFEFITFSLAKLTLDDYIVILYSESELSEEEIIHRAWNGVFRSFLSSIDEGNTPVSYSPRTTPEIISIPICYRAISLYEQGFQREDICNRLRIKRQTLHNWIERAKAIKALTVNNAGKVTSRHFSYTRNDKLLPAQLKSEHEIVLLNQYIANIKQHYSTNREAFKVMIRYALNNTSVSRSGIYFNSPEKLKSFFETSWLIIPKSHWRAMTHFMNASTKKEEWRLSLKGIEQVVERSQKGRNKKSNGAIRLELIDPNTRLTGKTKEHKHSSPTLMYLFHMMGIIMPIMHD